MGDNLPVVDLGTGRTAKAIAAGSNHTCAILDNASIKCWGQMHLDNWARDTNNRGDESSEMGDNLPAVDLGSGRTQRPSQPEAITLVPSSTTHPSSAGVQMHLDNWA